MGWTLSEPENVEKVALHFCLAFGGCVYDPDPECGETHIPNISYPHNPVGCGWLPSGTELKSLTPAVRERVEAHIAQLDTLAAPQIEDPLAPYTQIKAKGLKRITAAITLITQRMFLKESIPSQDSILMDS